MLDSSYKEKENAIEEVIYDFLKNCEMSEMSEQCEKMFLEIGMLPENIILPDVVKPLIFKMLEIRLEHCFTFKVIDERVLLVITLISKNIDVAMIYMWYIQGWCFKNNVTKIDFETLKTNIFPLGFFSDKDLNTVLENQKVQGMNFLENLVDCNIAGISIQFLEE